MPKGKYRDGRRNNRPPIAHQFKPGESGNKKGRSPKLADSIAELLGRELKTKHAVEIDGTRVRVPTYQLIIRRVVQLALKGDTKMLSIILNMWDDVQTMWQPQEPSLHEIYTPEKIATMSQEEITELYFKSLNEIGRPSHLSREESFPNVYYGPRKPRRP